LRTLAIIPARGGSKGIARKNLQPIDGVPLVVRAVQTALAATRVDKVVVSTDDDEIAETARNAGAEVLMRPAELAVDETPTIPVMQWVLDALDRAGWQADRVVLLEPTSPFRTGQVVDECVGKLDDPQVNSAVTVTQLERNPYNVFAVDGDRAERFIREPSGVFARRQQFGHLKRVNGCVYVTRASHVREGRLIDLPLRVVEMAAEDSINIDTPLDLDIARLIASRRGRADTDNHISKGRR
jgi:CMP-N,N'-diacetyllegionaminic acid synthase